MTDTVIGILAFVFLVAAISDARKEPDTDGEL